MKENKTMSLRELNEELHSRSLGPSATAGAGPRKETISAIPEPVSTSAPVVPLGEAWGGADVVKIAPIENAKISPIKRARRKRIAVTLGTIALIALTVGVVLKAGDWLFSPDRVRVSMTGPRAVESNQPVEFVIRYENGNWVDLSNAELIVTYPEMFRFTPADGFQVSGSRAVLSLGTVKKSSSNTVSIKGSFQSFQEQVANFNITLRAAPKGVASRVDTQSVYAVAVESSAIVLDFSVPSQVGTGQDTDYVVTYRNDGEETLSNLELRFIYPDTFVQTSSDPKPTSGENGWKLPTLGPGQSGTVTVRGSLTGVLGEVKKVFARVGVPKGDGSLLTYAEAERSTRIVTSPLAISQKIGFVENEEKKTVRSGEVLPYRILFRNDGDVGLRDLIVTVDLDPQYFNISQIKLGEKGTYNVAKQQIIFRAADQPVLASLEPGQTGQITFSVVVRNDLAALGKNNVEISSVARIDSPDVPTPLGSNKIIASNRIAFKVLTDTTLELLGYHYDANGNTGPIPPRVGQETTYTLTARITNSLNAVDGAKVQIMLPGGVRYIKTLAVTQGKVAYNDRTGEISWDISTLAFGIGRMIDLTLQIGFTPDPSQVGETARLVNSAMFTGRDVFGDQSIRLDAPPKTISLWEDPRIGSVRGGEVQPAQ